MRLQQDILTNQFEKDSKEILDRVKQLQLFDTGLLHQHPGENAWNALEIIAHLNLYSDFYLPEIEKAIKGADKFRGNKTCDFKSGFLGNYFAESMLPSEAGIIKNPMKTFKSKDTLGQRLDEGVIEKFIHQHEKLLSLINACRELDLNRTRTPISISRMIRLKLGDTLRFFINHEKRHLVQLNQCLEKVKNQDATSSI